MFYRVFGSQKTVVLALSLLLVGPEVLRASESGILRGIIGEDNRVIVRGNDAPWSAVGQVNISGYRIRKMCTGTLVAPDHVITAAHCVVDPKTNSPFAGRRIHFVAGVDGSDYKAHATGKCVHIAGSLALDDARQVSEKILMPDAAIIVLSEKISVPPASVITAEEIQSKPGLVHAAYSIDRRFALSAHFGCRLRQSTVGAHTWLNDCDTTSGSSGGPLFIRIGGQFKLAAIMIGRLEDGHLNVALPVSMSHSLMKRQTCGERGPP